MIAAAAVFALLMGLLFGGFGIVRAMGKNRLYQSASVQQPVLQEALKEETLTEGESEKWQDGWVKYKDVIYAYNE